MTCVQVVTELRPGWAQSNVSAGKKGEFCALAQHKATGPSVNAPCVYNFNEKRKRNFPCGHKNNTVSEAGTGIS